MALLASNVDADLSRLSPEERLVVLEVIRRDKDLRQNELDYIEILQAEIDRLIEKSIAEQSDDRCPFCGDEFWWLFRRGELCEVCRRKVCANCRKSITVSLPKSTLLLCILCCKDRELRALTGAWFYQSLKFRRSKKNRKSNKSRPPSISEPGITTPPPSEFFYYFSVQDKNVLHSGINTGGRFQFDQPTTTNEEEEDEDDASGNSLSEISEERDDDVDGESFDFIVNRNRRARSGSLISRIRFSSDNTDDTFGQVVERNQKLLVANGETVDDESLSFAKTAAEQIVGDVFEIKKEYAKIQLAANGLTSSASDAHVSISDEDERTTDLDYDEALALMDSLSRSDATYGSLKTTDHNTASEADPNQISSESFEVVAFVHALHSNDDHRPKEDNDVNDSEYRIADNDDDADEVKRINKKSNEKDGEFVSSIGSNHNSPSKPVSIVRLVDVEQPLNYAHIVRTNVPMSTSIPTSTVEAHSESAPGSGYLTESATVRAGSELMSVRLGADSAKTEEDFHDTSRKLSDVSGVVKDSQTTSKEHTDDPGLKKGSQRTTEDNIYVSGVVKDSQTTSKEHTDDPEIPEFKKDSQRTTRDHLYVSGVVKDSQTTSKEHTDDPGLKKGSQRTTGDNIYFSGVVKDSQTTSKEHTDDPGLKKGSQRTTGDNIYFSGVVKDSQKTSKEHTDDPGLKKGSQRTTGDNIYFSGVVKDSQTTSKEHTDDPGLKKGSQRTTGDNIYFSGVVKDSQTTSKEHTDDPEIPEFKKNSQRTTGDHLYVSGVVKDSQTTSEEHTDDLRSDKRTQRNSREPSHVTGGVNDIQRTGRDFNLSEVVRESHTTSREYTDDQGLKRDSKKTSRDHSDDSTDMNYSEKTNTGFTVDSRLNKNSQRTNRDYSEVSGGVKDSQTTIGEHSDVSGDKKGSLKPSREHTDNLGLTKVSKKTSEDRLDVSGVVKDSKTISSGPTDDLGSQKPIRRLGTGNMDALGLKKDSQKTIGDHSDVSDGVKDSQRTGGEHSDVSGVVNDSQTTSREHTYDLGSAKDTQRSDREHSYVSEGVKDSQSTEHTDALVLKKDSQRTGIGHTDDLGSEKDTQRTGKEHKDALVLKKASGEHSDVSRVVKDSQTTSSRDHTEDLDSEKDAQRASTEYLVDSLLKEESQRTSRGYADVSGLESDSQRTSRERSRVSGLVKYYETTSRGYADDDSGLKKDSQITSREYSYVSGVGKNNQKTGGGYTDDSGLGRDSQKTNEDHTKMSGVVNAVVPISIESSCKTGLPSTEKGRDMEHASPDAAVNNPDDQSSHVPPILDDEHRNIGVDAPFTNSRHADSVPIISKYPVESDSMTQRVDVDVVALKRLELFADNEYDFAGHSSEEINSGSRDDHVGAHDSIHLLNEPSAQRQADSGSDQVNDHTRDHAVKDGTYLNSDKAAESFKSDVPPARVFQEAVFDTRPEQSLNLSKNASEEASNHAPDKDEDGRDAMRSSIAELQHGLSDTLYETHSNESPAARICEVIAEVEHVGSNVPDVDHTWSESVFLSVQPILVNNDNNEVQSSIDASSPVPATDLGAGELTVSESGFGLHDEPIVSIQSDTQLFSIEEDNDEVDEAIGSQNSYSHPASPSDDGLGLTRSTSTMSSSVSDGRDSLASDLSTATSVRVTGEVCVEIKYNHRFTMLEVVVKACRNLAPVSHRYSNPYVKLYMVPDKCNAGKKKTKIKKRTLNPTFEETMRYDIKTTELSDCSLWISVWHSGRFSRNIFLGDVLVPLDDRIMTSKEPLWFQLIQQGREKWKSIASFASIASLTTKATIDLSLKYASPDSTKSLLKKATKGELHVAVRQASGLMSMKTIGLVTSFCKFCLLPEKVSRQSRHKTSTVKRNSNPVWNQTFVFPDVTLNDLMSSRTLQITVWNQDSLTSKSLIGKALLCPGRDGKFSDGARSSVSSQDDSVTLWQHMLSNPNEWCSGTVTLQQETQML